MVCPLYGGENCPRAFRGDPTGRRCGSAERKVAEWVIRVGGRVILAGTSTPVRDISQLPPGPLLITGVDLTNTIIEPRELEEISGLTGLRELYLPGPSWTPRSDSPLDANEALRYIAALKDLRRLYFSVHFLPTYNVNDKGIALLAGLTQLRELRLAQSRVATPDLTPFTQLTSLDLSECTYFGDEGMKALDGLKLLRRLYLRNTPVTDEGLKHLGALSRLREAGSVTSLVNRPRRSSLFRGLSADAQAKSSWRGASQMRRMDIVSPGMTHLRELNLYRSRITNAGLAKLENLKELRALDVRYSR